jgi:hypothetical protein
MAGGHLSTVNVSNSSMETLVWDTSHALGTNNPVVSVFICRHVRAGEGRNTFFLLGRPAGPTYPSPGFLVPNRILPLPFWPRLALTEARGCCGRWQLPCKLTFPEADGTLGARPSPKRNTFLGKQISDLQATWEGVFGTKIQYFVSPVWPAMTIVLSSIGSYSSLSAPNALCLSSHP